MTHFKCKGFRTAALCGWLGILAGCAAPVTQRIAVDAGSRAQEERVQQRLAVQAQAQAEFRLWSVGYGVLKGAASECGDVTRPHLGFLALSRDRIPEKSRELVSEALNLDDGVRIMAVFKGSAAEAAGLKKGDILNSTEILGKPGETRESARARLTGPIDVTVLRDGQTTTVSVTPDVICDYPLKVAPGSEVNAYANGTEIMVSRGMLRFATEDRELALVVGHELGHNTMGHRNKKQSNATIGLVVDLLAAAYGVNTQNAFANMGATAFSKDFEAEADYVGLYYLARAGYDTAGAADFWRRMAAEHPGSIKSNHAASHPATAERFLALEQVAGEVQGKLADQQPLVPNRLVK